MDHIDSYIAERSAFQPDFPRAALFEGQTGIGAEVGVCFGFFSDLILKTSKVDLLVSVDSWDNDTDYHAAGRLLSKHGYRSALLRTQSLTAASLFQDGFFDFVYIDAEHDYDHVKADIAAWYPKVKPGGFLSGHDYEPGWTNPEGKFFPFGVIEAVDEFAAANGLQVETVGGYRSWKVSKPQ
jgi:hypothetical protein